MRGSSRKGMQGHESRCGMTPAPDAPPFCHAQARTIRSAVLTRQALPLLASELRDTEEQQRETLRWVSRRPSRLCFNSSSRATELDNAQYPQHPLRSIDSAAADGQGKRRFFELYEKGKKIKAWLHSKTRVSRINIQSRPACFAGYRTLLHA